MDKLLKKNNFIEAVVWLAISLFVIIYGRGLHHGDSLVLSPALFPVIIGGFMLVMSLVLMKKSLREADHRSGEVAWLKVIIVVVLTALYIAVMPIIGFIAATMVYLVCMINFLGEKDLLKLGAVTVLTSGLLYYIFGVLLNVRLP